jgi:hypothetical protein
MADHIAPPFRTYFPAAQLELEVTSSTGVRSALGGPLTDAEKLDPIGVRFIALKGHDLNRAINNPK